MTHQLVGGDPHTVQAALELFERHDPESLEEAVALISALGVAPDGVFDEIADAWNHYRLIRDMPWD